VVGLVMTGAMTLPKLEFRGLGAPLEKSDLLSPVSVIPPAPRKTAAVEDGAGAAPLPS
jgi:hypothetical protein